MEALEVLEVMRRVLLRMLEAVECLEAMYRVLLCMLEVPEAMRCLEPIHSVLHCMLEAVEGGTCLPEVPKVMRCVLLCVLEGGLWAQFRCFEISIVAAVFSLQSATPQASNRAFTNISLSVPTARL